MKLKRFVQPKNINGVFFSKNTVRMEIDNTIILCDFERKMDTKSVMCYIYDNGWRWIRVPKSDEYVKIMRNAITMSKTKAYHYNDIVHMMRHSRTHKKGTGSRERIHTVTDYECRKVPLHNFPRSRYVQWN